MLTAFLYNAISIPLRVGFSLHTHWGALGTWLLLDYLCDAVYLIDVAMVKSHLGYTAGGVLEVRGVGREGGRDRVLCAKLFCTSVCL